MLKLRSLCMVLPQCGRTLSKSHSLKLLSTSRGANNPSSFESLIQATRARAEGTVILSNRYKPLRSVWFIYWIPLLIAASLPEDINPHSIFANNEISLSDIEVYGFDYDYTLAAYTESLQHLVFDMGKEALLRTKYVSSVSVYHFVRKLLPSNNSKILYTAFYQTCTH